MGIYPYMATKTKDLTALIASFDEHSPIAKINLAFPGPASDERKYWAHAAAALAALPTHNLSFDEALHYVVEWTRRYNCMGMMLFLRPRMTREAWLKLLGCRWTECDGLRHHVPTLRRVLGVAGPLLPMMDAEEQTAFVLLPDILTVYRGCSARFPRGICWSLNPDVARGFPALNWYCVPDSVLITATVRKQDVLAVKLDRQEEEVITFKARPVAAELITYKARRVVNELIA
jgi:hypothetical protein